MLWEKISELRTELESLRVESPDDWQEVIRWKTRAVASLHENSPPDGEKFAAFDPNPQWYRQFIFRADGSVDPAEMAQNKREAVAAKEKLVEFLNALLSPSKVALPSSIQKVDEIATPQTIRRAILDALYEAHHREPGVGLPWRNLIEALGISGSQFRAAMTYLSERQMAQYRTNLRCEITAVGIDEVERTSTDSITGDIKSQIASTDQFDLEILEQIDSGLYGRVFKARQIKLDRIVAVKIIKAEFSHQTDAVAHAKALARVGIHPNIVAVYGVEQVAIEGVEHPAMVMEWLDGEMFGKRLPGSRFSEQELRRICMGVIDGLERMHGSGMQHGDLHVGNIILLADCHPKIIDIDASKNRSLSRLSDVSREAAITADVDYCRRLVQMAFSHSVFSPSRANELDAALQPVMSLAEIRAVVSQALDTNQTPASIDASPLRTVPLETAESLSRKVLEYIEAKRPASLAGLINGTTRRLRDDLVEDKVSVVGTVSKQVVRERLLQYQQSVAPIMSALATGCAWGDESHWNAWKQCIETAANCYEDRGSSGRSGHATLLELRLYPPLLLFYASAFGAFANDRIATLRFLCDGLEYAFSGKTHALGEELHYWRGAQAQLWNQFVLDSRGEQATPISDHLADLCCRELRTSWHVQTAFHLQFDRFEYFLGLMRCPTTTTRDISVIPGTYLWRRAGEPDFSQYFLARARERGNDWAPFKAGLFDGGLSALHRTIQLFDEYVDEQRRVFHIRTVPRQRSD